MRIVPFCNIALFLLATGARLNEALSATWEQIDRDKRVWRIPAINSKSKRIRPVPRNDSALEVLSHVGTAGRYAHVCVNEDVIRMRETALLEMHHKEVLASGSPNDTSHGQVTHADVAGRPALALKCKPVVCVSTERDDRRLQTILLGQQGELGRIFQCAPLRCG